MTAPTFTGTKFPGALDDTASLPTQNPSDTITQQESNNQSAAIKAIETKLGITSSVDATSIDYLLKNTASGHHHDNVGSRRVTYANLASIPSTFTPAAHGASAHTGATLPSGSDQDFGGGSLRFATRTASGVPTPASGRTVFADAADGTLKVKTATGTYVALEAAVQPQLALPLVEDYVWTNMPSADTGFGGTIHRTLKKADLANFTEIRLTVAMGAVAGSAGSVLKMEYGSADGTTVGAFTAISGAQVDITVASAMRDSGWVSLPVGARIANCYVVLIGSGGNAAADPSIGSAVVQFR